MWLSAIIPGSQLPGIRWRTQPVLRRTEVRALLVLSAILAGTGLSTFLGRLNAGKKRPETRGDVMVPGQ
jgi:hypothetical protein